MVTRGTINPAIRGLGLDVPFLVALIGFSWFLRGPKTLLNRARPIRGVAGILLAEL